MYGTLAYSVHYIMVYHAIQCYSYAIQCYSYAIQCYSYGISCTRSVYVFLLHTIHGKMREILACVFRVCYGVYWRVLRVCYGVYWRVY